MLLTIFTATSYIITSLLLYSGIVGVLQPLRFARDVFAVPNATPETIVFYPGLAGRNVTCGLALLTFLLTGQTRAAGVVVLCLLCNGTSDCIVLLRREGSTQLGVHVFNMCVCAVTGTGLMVLG